MIIQKFEDIIAWQKSKNLSLEIYKIFKDSKDFGFKDQIQRASISIMNNIAEGFDRRGDKELKHFLYIAKGSCSEVRSMVYISKDLGYITEEEYDNLLSSTNEISKLIFGFIKTLD
jgi:four helix bundle protein